MKRVIVALVLLVALAGCGGSELAGLWVGVDPGMTDYQLELNADGTGAMRYTTTEFNEAITWTVEGDELCFTFGDDSGDCRPFEVDGDRMTLEMEGSDSPARLERWTD